MRVVESKNKSIQKTYLVYLVIVMFFILLRALVSEGVLVISDNPYMNSYYLNAIIQIGILFLLPLTLYCVFMKVTPKQVFKTCNYNKLNYKVILVALVFGVLAFIFNLILSSVFTGLLTAVGYKQATAIAVSVKYDIKDFLCEIVVSAIFPALFEEFVHRGLLLQGTKHAGYKRAIIISSILFGLTHLNIEQVFYATMLGFFLGVIVVATKNIWPAIIIHFVNNFIVVYINGATAFHWFGGDFDNKLYNASQSLGLLGTSIVTIVVFTVVVALMIFLVYLMYKLTVVKKVEDALSKTFKKPIKLTLKSEYVKDKNNEVRKVIDSTTSLNFDFENMKSFTDVVLPKQKYVYKTTLFDNVFLIISLMAGIMVTIFTFVWGLL